jgi:hypothetical protein
MDVFIKKLIRRQIPTFSRRINGLRLIGYTTKDPTWKFLYRFIDARGLLGHRKINVFSDNVARHYVALPSRCVKIFHTGENVHNLRTKCWEDNGIDIKSVELSLGYDYKDDSTEHHYTSSQ